VDGHVGMQAMETSPSVNAGETTPGLSAVELEDGCHPYGVKPEGNMWLDSMAANPQRRVKPCRAAGLGAGLHSLKDELVLNVLGYLDGQDLARAASISHAMYVFVHHEDLWRTLVLSAFGSGFKYQAGGWRSTFQHMVTLAHPKLSSCFVPHKPISVKGFYSDLLFQSWYCASAGIKPEWLVTNTIERRSAKTLSVEEFVRDYELPNRPVIITDCITKWPAFHKWTPDSLTQVAGDAKMDAGGFAFSMKDYFQYASVVHDDQPLYLFDKTFSQKVPQLGADYTVPDYFAEDLFSLLGDTRPDYRWLIAGPRKSGSVFHKDPNATYAWNACITGAKKWIMFPPHMCPPGVHASEDGSEVATPLSIIEWMMDFYEAAARARHREELLFRSTVEGQAKSQPKKRRVDGSLQSTFNRMKITKNAATVCPSTMHGTSAINASTSPEDPDMYCGPVEGVTRAGEVTFVPRGWWHLVLNIEDSIAITQNYVSSSNLPHVLIFLRDMKYAISGIDPKDADTMHERFVAALSAQKPEALAAAMAKIDVDVAGPVTENLDRCTTSNNVPVSARVEVNHRWSSLLGKDTTHQQPDAAPAFAFGFSFDK
jgi:hypothetical protein